MRVLYILFVVLLVLLSLYLLIFWYLRRRFHVKAILGLIPSCLLLFKNLIKDSQVPVKYKIVLVLIIGYLVFSIDIVPDFIPFAGQFDDAIVTVLALRYVLKGIGPELAAKYWNGPTGSLGQLLKLARIT